MTIQAQNKPFEKPKQPGREGDLPGKKQQPGREGTIPGKVQEKYPKE